MDFSSFSATRLWRSILFIYMYFFVCSFYFFYFGLNQALFGSRFSRLGLVFVVAFRYVFVCFSLSSASLLLSILVFVLNSTFYVLDIQTGHPFSLKFPVFRF